MATDAQTLLAQASCYSCFASNSYTLGLMKLALLRQAVLALSPMADTSPQALLAAAKCFECYGPNDYTLRLMELALLAQLSSGGAIAGQQVLEYLNNDPTSDGVFPTNKTAPAIAYHRSGINPNYNWRIDTQQWV